MAPDSLQPNETSQGPTLKPALLSKPPDNEQLVSRFSPRTAASKFVTIAEPESISPLMEGRHKDLDDDDAFALERVPSKQQHRVKIGKRLQGRPSNERSNSSNPSLAESALSNVLTEDGANRGHAHDNLVTQVAAWVKQEKARRAARRSKRATAKAAPAETTTARDVEIEQTDGTCDTKPRRDSDTSEGSTALDNLESIIESSLSIITHEGRRAGHRIGRRLRRHSTAASSDNEDLEVQVPNVDAWLDNSRTLAYSGGKNEQDDVDETLTPGSRKAKERQAWAAFKYEIVRLAHTLRLKGWRKIPMEMSGEIEVERLSGALTNAVYVVTPPKKLPLTADEEKEVRPRNPPIKLLLRIYGPQVEHLIDRESELQILRRLARKRIGPRLLGTFSNGRFEEYLHARPLTPQDLRNPDTSMQIAKRMRELHEGIDLLPQEREDGPFVWRNWDKWEARCEQITEWLDSQIAFDDGAVPEGKLNAWRRRGFVCGAEWKTFRATVEKYRHWVEEQYGGPERLKQKLVFAHNDTQHGNILRLVPPGDSPLLLPANEHKQLVVIDFEYSNANTPGLEFANHFAEWCYNYHDPHASHAFNVPAYPSLAEQTRFIRSYVTHRLSPSLQSSSNTSQPHISPLLQPHSPARPSHPTQTTSTSSITSFMLDSRAPPQQLREAEEREERAVNDAVEHLLAETRLWRMANSAQWVAWGIVQATVPGLPDFNASASDKTNGHGHGQHHQQDHDDEGKGDGAEREGEDYMNHHHSSSTQNDDGSDGGEDGRRPSAAGAANDDEDAFDYLGYAQERALFFWGDAVQLGIADESVLGEEMRARVKVVEA
ncbi:kinase-like domain-containing protein [Phyllosticta citricarpa]|uniref:Kinase-like domain-containing protein n=1 Tax=Phyllosticta paracitricarpa TaxID=2016321 RepID=A0ABR1N7X2_9PEZI